MDNEQRIILKEDVNDWSGFELTGETKDELKSSLDSIYDTLMNELSDKKYRFDAIIETLKID